jgi:hypothetical protein
LAEQLRTAKNRKLDPAHALVCPSLFGGLPPGIAVSPDRTLSIGIAYKK